MGNGHYTIILALIGLGTIAVWIDRLLGDWWRATHPPKTPKPIDPPKTED